MLIEVYDSRISSNIIDNNIGITFLNYLGFRYKADIKFYWHFVQKSVLYLRLKRYTLMANK